MDGESFAEKLKKFNQKPVMGIRTPKPHIINSGSLLESSQPEKLEQSKSNDLNQSFDDTNPTKSDSTTSSSQSSNERTLPRDAKLAEIIVSGLKKSTATLPKSLTIDPNESKHSESSSNHLQDTTTSAIPPNTTSDTNLKKPPTTLPKPLNNSRNENKHSESSSNHLQDTTTSAIPPNTTSDTNLKKPPTTLPKSFNNSAQENKHSESLNISRDTILYYPYPSDSNTFTDVKNSPVSLPFSVDSERNESQDLQSSSNLEQEILPPVISFNTNNFTSAKKGPAPLPNSLNLDQQENDHHDFVSISLDTMLTPKCMFYEFENTINDYKRRDPRTIIYRKMKITIPQITINEINILQRYSNK
ncbi:unnamed protein product [Rotaria sp. Silwood2]|nr:unnamed protein product [Rotaria sp. Silwood2]CAF2465946.1 unnamed protein product [Rotaria sp. Silwood2]CAF2855072.1 unnamed protein product [Rotaria sp. Silwood2]CAF4094053.1 unnamed protein product [Rotaria sp. Silwood2]CAF4102064.1 unnamed protein product [Rotaria sp. Silwood2]